MHVIDRLYTDHPFYGVRRITEALHAAGYTCNHKRVARLMRIMGYQAQVPGPHTSSPHPLHPVFPYLLRKRVITRPDEVWCADITYIPVLRGHMYLMAIMDWFSRYVLAWELSNTLDAQFCLDALEQALTIARPEIMNTDQGSQFTSLNWLKRILDADVMVSMDGRGRALDNVFIERLWRSVKYEDIYLHEYTGGTDVRNGLEKYMPYYNHERGHQSLGYRTPYEVYMER